MTKERPTDTNKVSQNNRLLKKFRSVLQETMRDLIVYIARKLTPSQIAYSSIIEQEINFTAKE